MPKFIYNIDPHRSHSVDVDNKTSWDFLDLKKLYVLHQTTTSLVCTRGNANKIHLHQRCARPYRCIVSRWLWPGGHGGFHGVSERAPGGAKRCQRGGCGGTADGPPGAGAPRGGTPLLPRPGSPLAALGAATAMLAAADWAIACIAVAASERQAATPRSRLFTFVPRLLIAAERGKRGLACDYFHFTCLKRKIFHTHMYRRKYDDKKKAALCRIYCYTALGLP